MESAVENAKNQKNWLEAAIDSGNLSELYLTIGEVGQAGEVARQSVEFYDRTQERHWQGLSRAWLADRLHQSGKFKESEILFKEAEVIQKEAQPDYPYLYSLPGFQFCDLLLSRGQYREVLTRAEYALNIRTTTPLLDYALNNLSPGRAHHLSARQPEHHNTITPYLARPSHSSPGVPDPGGGGVAGIRQSATFTSRPIGPGRLLPLAGGIRQRPPGPGRGAGDCRTGRNGAASGGLPFGGEQAVVGRG